MKKIIFCVFLLVSFSILKAQTSLTTDFNNNLSTGWNGGNFTLTAVDGELRITGGKPSIWDGIGYQFSALDLSLSEHKVLSMRIKSNSDFVITCALGNQGGKIDAYPSNGPQEVIGNIGFQTLTFDFSSVTGVVWNAINNLNIVFNPLSIYPGGKLKPNDALVVIDDVKIGSSTTVTPRINVVEDQYFTVSANVVSRTIPLLNIANGKATASNITVSASSSNTAVIPNPQVTYTSPNTTGQLTLNTIPNITGSSVITVTVSADGVATNKIISFNAQVNANLVPTLNAIGDFYTKRGIECKVPLTGISDGNPDAIQNISISATSSAPDIIPNPTIVYTQGATVGQLIFTPSATATSGSKSTITVTVSDNGGTANGGVDNVTQTFEVMVTEDVVNLPPTIKQFPSMGTPAVPVSGTLNLGQVTDGDGTNQSLTLTAVSSNPAIIKDFSGSVENGIAFLNYTLTGVIGQANITVTLTDNGGTAGNNGNQSTQMTFELSAIDAPLTGYGTTFPAGEVTYWLNAPNGTTGLFTNPKENGITSVDIASNTLHIRTNLPANSFPGVWFDLKSALGGKELDMSKNPYLTMRIKLASTNVVKPGKFTIALYDNNLPGSGGNNGYTTTMKAYTVAADDQFHNITIDYRGLFKATAQGFKVDSTRINGLLFNFDVTYFNTTGGKLHAGDYYIQNLKMGDQAENNPSLIPVTTIDAAGNVTMFKNTAPKPVVLKGISAGNNFDVATLTATTNNAALIQNLAVTNPTNGEAVLTYTLGVTPNQIDSAKITVISNNLANPLSVKDTTVFSVYVVDPAVSKATITFNSNTEYQTIAGMGGVVPNGADPNLIQNNLDMNYTIARVFTESDWEDVNDNADPNVLAFENMKFNMTLMDNMRKMNEKTNCKKIWWCSLTPPYWQKANKAIHPFLAAQGYANDNVLKPEMEDEFAETVLSAFKAAKEYAGVDLYGFSLQNEPEFNEPYGSAKMYGPQFVRLFKNIGPKLKAAGYGGARLMASEDIFTVMSWVTDRINAIKADPLALAELRTINVHNYDPNGIGVSATGSTGWSQLKTLKEGMPTVEGLWQTETSGFSNKWEGEKIKDYMNGTDIFSPGPLTYAANMYTAFKFGRIHAWVDLYSASEKVNKNLIGGVFKQYSKYAAVPGAKMVDVVSNDDDILTVGFKNPANNTQSIVLINRKSTPRVVSLTGSGIAPAFRIFTTQNNMSFGEGEVISNGTVVLPPRSISTLYSGDVTISSIGNQSFENKMTLEIYPNPARNTETVRVITNSESNFDKIEIFDLTGAIKLTQAFNKSNENNGIHVYGLSKGVYLVRISGKGAVSAMQKLVIK